MKRVLALIICLTSVLWAQPDPPTPSEREAGFLFRQGLALLKQEQVARARELFQKSLRLEPERLEVRPYLAKAHFLERDFEAALRQLNRYLDLEPKDNKVGLFRVRTLIALERYGQATDALNYLATISSEQPWEWHNLRGFLHEHAGELEQAEAAYSSARESVPEGIYEPQANLVSLWLSTDRVEEANELVGELLKEARTDPQVLNSFALLLSKRDEGFDPGPILEAVKDKETPFELQYNLAAALAERGEVEQAALLAAELVDRYPEEARASWIYGRLLLQRRELQDAGPFLAEAREKLPNTEELVATMGSYYYLTVDYEEAVGWFQQAISKNPEEAKYYHNLSLALLRTDNLESAAQASGKAVELSPDAASFVYQLALVYDRDGELVKAARQYRRFLELSENKAVSAIVEEHLAEIEGAKDE